ncbi:MAG: DUF2461 domain-containing protein [Nocardioidaceae bacterium]|nr:DUF2461 domain-containing protein [Nocardioidaceae bacterium]
MTAFAGVPVDALDFYDDLEQDNSKVFWSAHKERYETSVRGPVAALAAALEPEFGGAKLFRPYRDVRFAKDKTPYKTHQGAFVQTAPACGLYLEVNAAGLRTGAGWYHAEPDAKRRFRDAVDDDASGAALEALLDEAATHGFEVGGDRLKTSPRGWDADHPRIGLLRHNTLTLGKVYENPSWLPTAETLERVAADWRAARPLLLWQARHVVDPVDDDGV